MKELLRELDSDQSHIKVLALTKIVKKQQEQINILLEKVAWLEDQMGTDIANEIMLVKKNELMVLNGYDTAADKLEDELNILSKMMRMVDKFKF